MFSVFSLGECCIRRPKHGNFLEWAACRRHRQYLHQRGHAERVPPECIHLEGHAPSWPRTQSSLPLYRNGTPTGIGSTCTSADTRSASLQNGSTWRAMCSVMAANSVFAAVIPKRHAYWYRQHLHQCGHAERVPPKSIHLVGTHRRGVRRAGEHVCPIPFVL